MTDQEYIELMKKLRPTVIITPDLLQMFKAAYPPKSFKLATIKAMVGANEALKARHEKRKEKHDNA